jgi:hypothetical protein
LPDFQRGWVWDDDRIRALLASVSMSYPVGVVMLLETGGEGGRFKPRRVEGVPPSAAASPQKLILDGQQRLTSLYLALRSGRPVPTRTAKGADTERVYYRDMARCLDQGADREEAVLSLPPDRMHKSNFDRTIELDVSTCDKQYQQNLVPLDIFFDMIAYGTRKAGYLKHFSGDRARFQLLLDFDTRVCQRFLQYRVPVIEPVRDTPKEDVCQVFEKVSTGGVSLTVFELLTATFAAENYPLRKDWEGREKRFRRHPVIRSIENTDLLQAITLLATHGCRAQALAQSTPADGAPGVSCKRRAVLRQTLPDFRKWADPVTEGFERAAKLFCALRVYDARDMPYRKQFSPLAAILAALGDRADGNGVWSKIARWYWCGVFGELYGGAIETRFAKDLPEVLAWIDGGPEPSTVTEATLVPARLLTLRTRNSAAYKGLHALLMLDGGLDFRTGFPIDVQTYFDEKIDIHHLFPQKWCEEHDIDPKRRDCVVNKAPLSARTNRKIGGNAPSAYLPTVQKSAGIDLDRMDAILRSHLIEPGALRADDFDAFFQARAAALLERIEEAMGKPVAGELVEPDAPEDTEDEAEAEEVSA